MMPLTMAKEGEAAEIQRVGGKEDVRRHLENMGFVPGAKVTVISINRQRDCQYKGVTGGHQQGNGE